MNKLYEEIKLLMAIALVFILYGNVLYLDNIISSPKQIVYDGVSARDLYVELPKLVRESDPMVDRLEPVRELNRTIASVPITVNYERLVLGNGYSVFLTAYCAEECGWNYSTSSGAICHRSSDGDRYEPTTCAIDLHYFSYGTMFYIPSEDRVYIAEDTGAFKGMWLDLYQDDISDVYGYNTRYEEVYVCWFEEIEETYYLGGYIDGYDKIQYKEKSD